MRVGQVLLDYKYRHFAVLVSTTNLCSTSQHYQSLQCYNTGTTVYHTCVLYLIYMYRGAVLTSADAKETVIYADLGECYHMTCCYYL